MPRLFKYMKSCHLEKFFTTGELRIGTLYEYRNEEAYGKARGDAQESSQVTTLNAPKGMVINSDDRTPEMQFLRTIGKGNVAPDVTFNLSPGVRINVTEQSPDYYVYCMAASFSEDVMMEFGCDSCMEITSPEGFCRSITHILRHRAAFLVCAPVVYATKITDYTRPHPISAALLKDPRYEPQDEVRALWSPKKKPKAHLMLKVPKAIKHCRVHHKP